MQSISNFWVSISNFFSKRDQPPVVKAVPYPIQSKNQVQPHPPRSILGIHNVRLHAAQQDAQADYKLVIQEPSFLPTASSQKQQQLEMCADLIEDVNQLPELFQKLSITEEKLREDDRLLPEAFASHDIRLQTLKTDYRRDFELKQQYQTEIVGFLGLKYSRQISQYPQIELKDYRKICEYWRGRNKGHLQIKATSFDCVQKLTFKALGGLYFKEWLNDDVINIYIEMMEKRFIRENITSYRILNSYFATNTLGKTETQIQRVLKKKTLDKSHILIMPINSRNHWYFAIFDEGEIVVHDSMKHDANYYLENPIFKNALKFSKMFYERQYTLVVRDDYPQQDNHYDCGVFMLMGIRDTLRKKQWTFHQGDIRFKRIQIAHEILEENLIFSDL